MSYVYIRSELRLWTVGFYTPDGKWEPESDHSSTEEAAQRVAWLNGGGHVDRLESRISELEDTVWEHQMAVPHAESQA